MIEEGYTRQQIMMQPLSSLISHPFVPMSQCRCNRDFFGLPFFVFLASLYVTYCTRYRGGGYVCRYDFYVHSPTLGIMNSRFQISRRKNSFYIYRTLGSVPCGSNTRQKWRSFQEIGHDEWWAFPFLVHSLQQRTPICTHTPFFWSMASNNEGIWNIVLPPNCYWTDSQILQGDFVTSYSRSVE
jgi:hypothetical protein